ncbi:Domain of unknown function (DUF1935), putative [Angomonas deanei]|uniref:DUF1935 domain-containing protein n=1 Tax=Angomonas deanei TaxID=59799 RepID=A0A7G2CL68_9TRYP|nr:Domain of unknown function (DUF1935), putative [Angomonas deanei]CAD2219317.1 Domain of unknown function (DUF1935), putative [Angomonas deanei]
MADEIKYENGEPTYNGATVKKCFKENGNGLLFQIINDEEKKWAFYNDTKNYKMIVKVAFGETSKITALGKTTQEVDPETKEIKCELEIAPGATEMFIEGEPNGFKIGYNAEPIPK